MKTCNACKRDLPDQRFDLMYKAGGGETRGRRGTCRACMSKREVERAQLEETQHPKRFTRALDGAKRFIITAAQNATPVDTVFFATLKLAAEEMGAELIVIPLRYKNPTSIWSKDQESEEWWDAETHPYLHNTRKKLCPNLILAADVKVQPTASSPLQGFEAMTGAESCIIGHPKMQFKSVPVPSGRFPKILSTTGVCTRRNYTDSKAGKLGSFHHFLGAVVVELDGSKFHLRQLNANREDGSFIDLDKLYTSDGVQKAPPALALVCGDTHVAFTDKGVDRATFGPGGIVETLQPADVVFHDLFDGYSVNPHHAGNPFIAQAKFQAHLGDVRAEIEKTIKFASERVKGRRGVIVASNHDNFLSRWIVNTDWRGNPGNARFYLETALAMLDSVKRGPGGAEYEDPFRYWVEKLKGDAPLKALAVDESHMIGGNECGLHGDRGPNGARGTLKNMARLGTKVVSAHEHAPGIEEGNYKVGTSTPRKLEYTGGPSSWLNTHCVIYANGKRALISIFDEAWRLP